MLSKPYNPQAQEPKKKTCQCGPKVEYISSMKEATYRGPFVLYSDGKQPTAVEFNNFKSKIYIIRKAMTVQDTEAQGPKKTTSHGGSKVQYISSMNEATYPGPFVMYSNGKQPTAEEINKFKGKIYILRKAVTVQDTENFMDRLDDEYERKNPSFTVYREKRRAREAIEKKSQLKKEEAKGAVKSEPKIETNIDSRSVPVATKQIDGMVGPKIKDQIDGMVEAESAKKEIAKSEQNPVKEFDCTVIGVESNKGVPLNPWKSAEFQSGEVDDRHIGPALANCLKKMAAKSNRRKIHPTFVLGGKFYSIRKNATEERIDDFVFCMFMTYFVIRTKELREVLLSDVLIQLQLIAKEVSVEMTPDNVDLTSERHAFAVHTEEGSWAVADKMHEKADTKDGRKESEPANIIDVESTGVKPASRYIKLFHKLYLQHADATEEDEDEFIYLITKCRTREVLTYEERTRLPQWSMAMDKLRSFAVEVDENDEAHNHWRPKKDKVEKVEPIEQSIIGSSSADGVPAKYRIPDANNDNADGVDQENEIEPKDVVRNADSNKDEEESNSNEDDEYEEMDNFNPRDIKCRCVIS